MRHVAPAQSFTAAEEFRSMDALTSKRIDALRLFCVCMIVGLHVPSQAKSFKVTDWTDLSLIAWRIVPHGFGRFSLYLLFILTGYLFFLTYTNTLATYKDKIRKRIRSLIIPYVLWNIIAFFILTGSLKHVWNSWGLYDYINIFFYKMAGRRPMNFPLWYVQQVIYCLFLSPLLYALYRRLPWLSLPLFYGLYASTFYIDDLQIAIILRAFFMATAFMGLGGVIAMNRIRIAKHAIWDTAIIGVSICVSVWVNTFLANGNLATIYNLGLAPVGAYALWALFRYLPERWIHFLAGFNSYSFLIFGAHVLILGPLSKLLLSYYPWRGAWAKVAFGQLNMWITILLCIVVGALLKRFSPPVFKALTGWRS
jgi:hypothetical protein